MKRKKWSISVFFTLVIILTASMTACAATVTEHSLAPRNHTNMVRPAPHYKYTFQAILV